MNGKDGTFSHAIRNILRPSASFSNKLNPSIEVTQYEIRHSVPHSLIRYFRYSNPLDDICAHPLAWKLHYTFLSNYYNFSQDVDCSWTEDLLLMRLSTWFNNRVDSFTLGYARNIMNTWNDGMKAGKSIENLHFHQFPPVSCLRKKTKQKKKKNCDINLLYTVAVCRSESLLPMPVRVLIYGVMQKD